MAKHGRVIGRTQKQKRRRFRKKPILLTSDMRKGYDFGKVPHRKNPYAKQLNKQQAALLTGIKRRRAMTSDEIEKLAAQIRRHNKAYWIDHKPEIADTEYDKMVETLRGEAPFHPVLGEIVEDEAPAERGKVDHAVPMLSLDKVFTPEEIVKWATAAKGFGLINKVDGTEDGLGLAASYKIDGSSCSLLYENGKLVRGATRGNGHKGDDITPNVRVIGGIPETVPTSRKVEVRGEIYMTNASFKENIVKFEHLLAIGKATEDDRPSNPRNYTAGSMKQKDPNKTKERNLSFMAHGFVDHSGRTAGVTREEGVLKILQRLGFETPFYKVARKPEEVAGIIADIEKARKSLPYDTDGVVFALSDLCLHDELGCTSHHPRYKIAFKYSRDQGETEITVINWETSRTGRVVPQIGLKPISLGGATVSFCTGHNAKGIIENGLAPGAMVLMEREVIPYLVKRTKAPPSVAHLLAGVPSECPSCSTKLIWDETKTDLICSNKGGCPAQLLDYICHYVSRPVTNMMGVGEEIVGKMIKAKFWGDKGVRDPSDLYILSDHMLVKAGVATGETSAKNIVEAIKKAREQSLATFLFSLGIPDLGKTVSEYLADKFKTLDVILNASVDELRQTEKVGDKLSVAIHDGLKSRAELIKSLRAFVTIKAEAKTDGPLSGKSFCLTGHVEFEHGGKKYDARPDIENLIKAKGGSVKNVSKNLNFLIVGDEPGDKVDRAKKAGVPIIDGKAFAKMLGQP